MDATTTIYRQCFGTDVGKRVLGNLMVEAKFFDHCGTPEEQAVANFVKTILSKCGCYDPNNIDEYVTMLMQLRVEYQNE
jgi:hypothetical protein